MIDLSEHLTPEQLADYKDHKRVLNEAYETGTHHWLRRLAKRDELEFVEVKHCVAFWKPYDLEAPLRVMYLNPYVMAELMAGGIHPPIDAVHDQKLLIFGNGKSEVIRRVDAPEWKALNGFWGDIPVDNRRVHLEVQGPLTYEEAINYLIQMDLPKRVWGEKHNRPQYSIVEKSKLPASREHRASWELTEDGDVVERVH